MRPFTDVLAVNHFPFFFFFQIFIEYPNGRVIEHETNPEEKMLAVTNLALENYKAAAHGVMNFEPLKGKVLLELGKQVKREIKRYSKDRSNVFKYRSNLEKLAEFTNESLLKDVEEKIPSLHTFVKASVQGCQKVKNPVNQEALIISSYLNLWMLISNFAYRSNIILVLGGCKKEEVDCFHELGLSSDPNTLRNMQKKAAASFDKSVNEWKIDTVNRHNKIKLLEEVINSLSEKDENAMEICTVDFSLDAVSKYKNYSDAVSRACKEMLPRNQDDLFEDTDVLSLLDTLKGEKTQNFRYYNYNLKK